MTNSWPVITEPWRWISVARGGQEAAGSFSRARNHEFLKTAKESLPARAHNVPEIRRAVKC